MTDEATRPAPTDEGALVCCPFRIGGTLLACRADRVEAVTTWETPLQLPRVPAHILGLVTYDQRALALLDLGRFFGLTEDTDYTRVLVVTAGPYRVGIPVNAALGVVELAPGDRQEPSGVITGPLAQYVAEEVQIGDQLGGLLDLERLLEAARA